MNEFIIYMIIQQAKSLLVWFFFFFSKKCMILLTTSPSTSHNPIYDSNFDNISYYVHDIWVLNPLFPTVTQVGPIK